MREALLPTATDAFWLASRADELFIIASEASESLFATVGSYQRASDRHVVPEASVSAR